MSQRLSDKDRRAMLYRYAAGESSVALGVAYGVSASTVRFHAQVAGLTGEDRVPQMQHVDEAWMRHGRCAETDPGVFYPEKGGSPADARRVCEGCEVRAECLAYAIEHDERWGVWGGTTEGERRAIRRARNERRESA